MFFDYDVINSMSIDFMMTCLLFKKNMYNKNIISIQLYDRYNFLLKGFLEWYKKEKHNGYKPTYGINKMYNYHLLKYIYDNLNKNNCDLTKLIKIWLKYKYDENYIKNYNFVKDDDLNDINVDIDDIINKDDLSNNYFEFLSYRYHYF